MPDLMDDRDTFIRDLAAVFMVSQAAMTLRLMELKMISL